MATYAQMAMAGQEAQDRAAFEAAHNKEQARRTKAAKWGGWGRTLGLLGAGVATAATGGLAAPVAAGLVGLGGLAGRSAGRAMAGGRERDADKNIDALFHQGEQRKFGKEIGDYQAGMRERMMADTGKDALSAFMMAKYFKPGMDKMKGKFLGRFGSPDQKLGLMTGDPNARQMIDAAKAQSQAITNLDRMPGEAMFDKADPSTWGRTPPPGASMLGPTPSPAGITNPVGPYGVNPVQQFGTDPLGATNISDPLSGLPSPYSPTAPVSNTYGAAVDRGRAMSGQGMLNDTIRQSLGLPTSVPDQMGGMNYQQWMGQSDNAFESFMNQGQGQEGSLFDMISPHMQQPRRMVY